MNCICSYRNIEADPTSLAANFPAGYNTAIGKYKLAVAGIQSSISIYLNTIHFYNSPNCLTVSGTWVGGGCRMFMAVVSKLVPCCSWFPGLTSVNQNDGLLTSLYGTLICCGGSWTIWITRVAAETRGLELDTHRL